MTNPTRTIRSRARRLLGLCGAAAGMALLLTACDGLLDVEAPDRLPADQLDDPGRADLLVRGAIADFDCALGAYIVLGGMTADELTDATQTADRWPYDRREVRPTDARYATFGCTAIGTYTPLSAARWSAENARQKLQGWTDLEVGGNRTELIATAAAYSGYSHVLLGEGFCSGVLLDESLEPGGEVSSQELFTRAEERFGEAIEAAQAAGSDEILNMARVGRARARLNMGNGAGAVADASEVEEGFVRVATASAVAERRRNRIFEQNNDSEAVSVAGDFRDVQWDGVPDPRVDVIDGQRTATDGTPLFFQTKYESDATPIPIASWDEAQLIIAEVEGGSTAVDIINFFHGRAGLPPFSSSDPEEIQEHVIQERSRELFLEGQRFYDKRRMDLPFSPPVGEPFDNGGFYGETRCWPLPDVERNNNPNI